MSLPPFSVSTRASVIVATNTLPDPKTNTSWRTPELMRRVVILPMMTRALELTPMELPRDEESRLSWLMSCLSVRLNHPRPPLSTRSLLLTLYASDTERALDCITVDHSASVGEVITANTYLNLCLDTNPIDISNLLAYMSRHSVLSIGGVNFIHGIRLL